MLFLSLGFLQLSPADVRALTRSSVSHLHFRQSVRVFAAGAIRAAVVAVAASASAAIELDAFTSSGDTVTIAATESTAGGRIAQGREGATTGTTAREIGADRRGGTDFAKLIIQRRLYELVGQIIETRGGAVVGLTNPTGSVGL